jgi:hypothetical protein
VLNPSRYCFNAAFSLAVSATLVPRLVCFFIILCLLCLTTV